MFVFTRGSSGDRIVTEEHGDMNIVEIKFETKSDIVVACERNDTTAKKVFQLHKNAKSDQVLFIANVVERWEMLKHRFVGNDNYTDYFPAWYPDLADVVAGKSTIIRGLDSDGGLVEAKTPDM